MAEREGFEPPIPFQVWPLSRRLVSTAHAPLRVKESELSVLPAAAGGLLSAFYFSSAGLC